MLSYNTPPAESDQDVPDLQRNLLETGDEETELTRRMLELEDDLTDAAAFDDDEDLGQDQQIRPELIDRVVRILQADSERAAGKLQRRDLERQCFRRGLTIPECLRVETSLEQSGVDIADPAEVDSAHAATGSPSRKYTSYLSDVEERALGRTIQLARREGANGSAADQAYLERLKRDAAIARARFVESNIRWVHQVAKRFAGYRHLTPDDLFQEGILGLIRATESYDPEIGFRFKTYATWWIDQKIRRALDDKDRMVRLPVHVAEKVRAVRRAAKELLARTGEEPGIRELADTVGMDAERLAQLLWTVGATDCVEGDAPADIDDPGGSSPVFAFVPDNQTLSPFDATYKRELLRIVRRRLSKREARVILLRFGLAGDGEHTLEEVGAKFNLTRERVRQIQEKALKKLRPVIEKTVYERDIDHGGLFRTWRKRTVRTV